MEAVYIALFILFAVPAALLEYSDNACFGLLSGSRAGQQQHKQEYLRFRNNYVVIFSLMMGELWWLLEPAACRSHPAALPNTPGCTLLPESCPP